MNIIKTGIGIGKTIKNASRFREILTVFARHGFDEFIIKSKLNLVIPNFVLPKSIIEEDKSRSENDKEVWQSVGYRLKKSFEQLGPSFIKLGQLLATREDIFHPEFISEMKELQTKAKAISFEEAKVIIEKSIGGEIDTVFEKINPEPIGVASIGIVYEAWLKSGEHVVIKVRRPSIKKNLLTDFEIISFIINKLESVIPELKFLGVSRAIDDFFKSINLELNFLIEANNNEKLVKNLSRIDKDNIFKIPKVYKEHSCEKLLVMEFLDGTPFNEIEDIIDHPELKEKLLVGVRLFIQTMLADGFFHADLHGGNFFKLNNDPGIGLIDFGLVGTLSKKGRMSLVAILYAVLTSNYENLVYEFLDVAEYEVIPDHDLLVKDIKDALAPYIGLTVQEMDATAFTYSIVSTLSKHQIYLPRDWFIIFRAIMTLDGVGKSLNLDLNIFEMIDGEIKGIINELVSKEAMMEEAMWLGRDTLNSIRVLPRHIKWILKEFAKKKYTFDLNVKGINSEISMLTRALYFLGLIILGSTFFMAGAMLATDVTVASLRDIPLLTLICWALSAITVIQSIFLFKLSTKEN